MAFWTNYHFKLFPKNFAKNLPNLVIFWANFYPWVFKILFAIKISYGQENCRADPENISELKIENLEKIEFSGGGQGWPSG